MTENVHNDWDLRSEEVQKDQVAAYDAMRRRCPVAHDEFMGYSVFKNADVQHVLDHPEIYSNVVSTRHIAVPNGMDAPEHTTFRAVNDKYFTPERLEKFAPVIRDAVKTLISELPRGEEVDVMQGFGQAYAMRVQNAFMGWPACLEQPLTEWIEKNRVATLRRDREEIAKVALEFDGYIRQLLDERREDAAAGNPKDVTAELLTDTVQLPGEEPRAMTDEEIVSLIRNWTVGELSTVSATVGVFVNFLARNRAEQDRLRASLAEGNALDDRSEIALAVEEIMRLEDTLVTNRRITTQDTELGGRTLPAGSRVTINWASANRDEDAFEDALTYNPHRDQSRNLVYGDGIHVCPGAPLARLELRILLEELLRGTESIEIADESEKPATVNAVYPVSGYSVVRAIFN
ncbi:cytochrome P450 [Rothia mucilaginosa]|uniref:cytochrome P450 n=1 Tax=Rothia mucilaginosa TaxID=43675 RepID=UPI003C78FF84